MATACGFSILLIRCQEALERERGNSRDLILRAIFALVEEIGKSSCWEKKNHIASFMLPISSLLLASSNNGSLSQLSDDIIDCVRKNPNVCSYDCQSNRGVRINLKLVPRLDGFCLCCLVENEASILCNSCGAADHRSQFRGAVAR